LKAGVAVLIAHICLKLFGLIQNNIVPNYFGPVASDVFIFVYGIVISTAFNIGEQCMAPAVLPVFAHAREKDGEARAWRCVSTIFNAQLIVLLAVTLLLIFAAKPITGALTQWDVEMTLETAAGRVEGELLRIDAEAYVLSVNDVERSVPFDELKTAPNPAELASLRKDLAKKHERSGVAEKMLPWMAPGLIGMSLASITYVILNAYKEFFWAAIGDSILKLCVLLGAVLGALVSKRATGEYANWQYLIVGAVAGGTLKMATHVIALRWSRLRLYRPSLDFRDPYVREFLILMLPLFAGIFISSGRDMVINNVLTTQELLPTYFKQGKSAIDTLSFLVPYTLSIALLPYFCDLSAQGDNAQLGALLTRTIRMLLWFFVPVSIVLAVAAVPVCFVLFSGKLIDAEMSKNSALVMQCFSLQLPFAALEIMVMQAFFSNRRMIAPTVAGLVFSMLAAGAAYWLVISNRMESATDILLTVALCLVISKIIKSILLVGMLRTTVPVMPAGETFGFLSRLVIAGAGSAAAAWSAGWLWRAAELSARLPGKRAGPLGECIAIGLAGAVVYLILSLLLRMHEPSECWYWTREKLKRRGKKTSPPATAG